MSFYGDAWDHLRENRERRARQSGEYSSRNYADDGPYSGGARPSPRYDTSDGYSQSYAYGSSYTSFRSGGRSPPFSDHERERFRNARGYDEPPSPGPHPRTTRRPSFAERSSDRPHRDDPAYDFDAYDSDTDRSKRRFSERRERPTYTRGSPSPPPPRRGGYDFDEGLHSRSSGRAPRWVAAEVIEELDDNDPRRKVLPRAPYIYVGTEDPDGTVVDDPLRDGPRSGETPRSSGRYGGASSADERYGSRRDSGRHDHDPYGDSFEGASSYGRRRHEGFF